MELGKLFKNIFALEDRLGLRKLNVAHFRNFRKQTNFLLSI